MGHSILFNLWRFCCRTSNNLPALRRCRQHETGGQSSRGSFQIKRGCAPGKGTLRIFVILCSSSSASSSASCGSTTWFIGLLGLLATVVLGGHAHLQREPELLLGRTRNTHPLVVRRTDAELRFFVAVRPENAQVFVGVAQRHPTAVGRRRRRRDQDERREPQNN